MMHNLLMTIYNFNSLEADLRGDKNDYDTNNADEVDDQMDFTFGNTIGKSLTLVKQVIHPMKKIRF